MEQNQAVDGLLSLFCKANRDLSAVHNKLHKEFQQVYPDHVLNSHPPVFILSKFSCSLRFVGFFPLSHLCYPWIETHNLSFPFGANSIMFSCLSTCTLSFEVVGTKFSPCPLGFFVFNRQIPWSWWKGWKR